jgi:GntP family gluconate:H+ symporter
MLVLYLVISIILIIFLTARLKVHPFIVLLLVAILYGVLAGMPLYQIVSSVNEGFGGTLGKIGIIIVLGVIIGAFLENSGGAYTLAEKVLSVIGRKRVLPAMGITGYIVSIPVFADSGFLLISPLNKSLSKKAGLSLAGTAVALALGLTVTHTLVPPTPGPVAAAGILNADLGLVMTLALPISALALVPGLIYASRYVSKTYIPASPEISEAEINSRLKEAPGFARSSLPIIVPILLIVLKSVVASSSNHQNNNFVSFISFFGEPVIALLIGVFLAFMLPKQLHFERMLSTSGWVGKALNDTASIILITGAGGIFGKVLQNSGISELLGSALGGTNLGIWLPFLLAAAIKTAQGSSTVAMITAASIVMPMMEALGFGSEIARALVATAIGAGSIVFSHANDSFFWVVTQLSGMDVKTGYKLFSVGTLVLGISAGIVTFVFYLILA